MITNQKMGDWEREVKRGGMTLEQFRKWIQQAAAWYRREEPWMGGTSNRTHANDIRKHDPALAVLYEKAADAQDAIREYVLSHVEER